MNVRARRGRAVFLLALFLSVMLVSPQVGHATPDETPFTEIDDYIAVQMDESRIPGVALSVIEGGEVLHSRGYGHTSDGSETVSPDTLFGIGSTGKSITALGVMQLAEAGQINLDIPVQEYIPWFTLADSESTADLTVRHLLNMTSGIPAAAGGEAFRSTESMTPEAAIRTLQTTEFAHEPGSTFEYVNANYVILGHLIEVISGQSYGSYVQEHIFEPLEMHRTYTDPEAARQAGFDAGHRYWFGRPIAHEMNELPALVPAGYIISTAEDLSNYLSMYLNDGTFNGREILSAAGIAEMHRGVAEATLGPWAGGATATYAMGWYVGGPWDGGSVIFHPGSEPTSTAMLTIDRLNNRGTITLMNAATEMPLPGAAGALRTLPAGIVSILNGEEPGTASLNRFYLIFDLAIAIVIGLQIFALARLIRQSPAFESRWIGRALPLIWEFGLAAAIFLAPGALGMSWRSILLWTPDLGIAAMAIAGLTLITGLIRLERMIWHRPARTRVIESVPTADPKSVIQRPVS